MVAAWIYRRGLSLKKKRVEELLKIFAGKSLLVVGDLILDEFVWGKVSRISPEAPVPVVEVVSETYYPGGAANVARNLREFSDRVRVMGLVGEGPHAEQLIKLLREHKITLDCLQQDAGYQTIVKTRIIARQQQVVRVDREQRSGLNPIHFERSIERITELLPEIDAIILEDYGKGLLEQNLVNRILTLANAAGKIVTVDPNPRNNIAWHSVTAITPNRSEAFAAAGAAWSDPVDPPHDDDALMSVGHTLQERWDAKNLLITLGEQGMMLFTRGESPLHIPTRAREVFDVSGAGDTAIALFTLALCSGASPLEAAEISNHASGIVVGKLGTATVTPSELLDSFDQVDAH
jgi:rfaE bifunctional protein kinase chain/domain